MTEKEFLDYYKPFEDFEKDVYSNIFTRVIAEDVEKEQLIWHKDKTDRVVKVIYGTGWKLQKDNELPFELEIGNNYHINKEQFHRLLKGDSELKLEIKEL
jgi:hypothetical protein